MSTSNIHLLQFKILSHVQKKSGFKFPYIKTHTEENPSKISKIAYAILSFSHKDTLTKSPSLVLWNLLLLMKPPDLLQNGSFYTKNVKSRTQRRTNHSSNASAHNLFNCLSFHTYCFILFKCTASSSILLKHQ